MSEVFDYWRDENIRLDKENMILREQAANASKTLDEILSGITKTLDEIGTLLSEAVDLLAERARMEAE